jgi:hypothetical protein
LMVFLALASAIRAVSLWASSWRGMGCIWEGVVSSWDVGGKSLGIYSDMGGRSQGKPQWPAGENLSGFRLDVGVSQNQWRGQC